MVGVAVHLNGYTNAAFNDVEEYSFGIITEWEPEAGGNCDNQHPGWDCSSITVVENAEIRDGKIIITVGVGENPMIGTSKWEVFIAEGNGNNEQLTYIDKGTYGPISSNGSITIEYTPSMEGNYRFLIYRPEGHPKADKPIKVKVNFLLKEQVKINTEADLKKGEHIELKAEDPVEGEAKVEEPVTEEPVTDNKDTDEGKESNEKNEPLDGTTVDKIKESEQDGSDANNPNKDEKFSEEVEKEVLVDEPVKATIEGAAENDNE